MTALERLYNAAVVPVVVLDDAADAVPTAKASARQTAAVLRTLLRICSRFTPASAISATSAGASPR